MRYVMKPSEENLMTLKESFGHFATTQRMRPTHWIKQNEGRKRGNATPKIQDPRSPHQELIHINLCITLSAC